MSPRHPMQPIENVDGVARFKPNKIVQYLLESGPYQFDEIGYLDFSDEDREQFAQLLGISVADYVELPYVSERSSHEAQLAEDELNPSNPYAWELSWVDETNASCEPSGPMIVGSPEPTVQISYDGGRTYDPPMIVGKEVAFIGDMAIEFVDAPIKQSKA
jgi:hypothetical protein